MAHNVNENININNNAASILNLLCLCFSYLAMSPLYRDLYIQLAGSGLRSTQNNCPMGDWMSSNQEKPLPCLAACDLYTTDARTHTHSSEKLKQHEY